MNLTLRHRLPAVAMLAAALALTGCASSVKLDDAPVESRTPTATGAGGAGSTAGSGVGSGSSSQTQVANVDLSKSTGAGALGKVVYFDFDSFLVKDEFRPVVEGHGRLLGANRSMTVVVEGHTDSRGGSEYNLALGQKRAEAVAQSLKLLGAQSAQVEAVSYGKERPAAAGNDESAWAKNRRAELRDR